MIAIGKAQVAFGLFVAAFSLLSFAAVAQTQTQDAQVQAAQAQAAQAQAQLQATQAELARAQAQLQATQTTPAQRVAVPAQVIPGSDGLASYPSSITCQKVENFGVVTEGSAEHPRDIVMNFSALADGQYSYGGFAKNWKDGGSGESVSAFYDAKTGAFMSGNAGIVCPQQIGS